jgi:hypothetical protein
VTPAGTKPSIASIVSCVAFLVRTALKMARLSPYSAGMLLASSSITHSSEAPGSVPVVRSRKVSRTVPLR